MIRNGSFLRKEYLKNLFPIMFSVLGGTINALIDSVLVSQKLGSEGLTAVTMCLPLYLIICTIGSLIAGGAQVLSAQAVGREEIKEANQYYHTALLTSVMSGIVIMIVGVPCARPIAVMLAQGGSLTSQVYAYGVVSLIGAVFLQLVYLPLFYLQLEGKTREITRMIFLMVGVDVVLDIVLMFVIDGGLYGAAAASVLSSAAACGYGLYQLMGGNGNYNFEKRSLRIIHLGKILHAGSPIALGNFYDAIRLFVLNSIILYAGGAKAAAVWAVLNTLSELSLCISSGVPQAAAPMTGVYYTAGENSGIRILIQLQNQCGLLLTGVFTAILLVGHRLVGAVFSIQGSLFFPLACLGVSIAGNVLGSIWTTLFNSTEKILLSNLLTAFRRLICPVAAAAVLFFYPKGLWLFLPLGSGMALLAGWLCVYMMAQRSRKKEYPLSAILLLDDHLEREHKILDFSIRADMQEACSASEQIQDFCMANHMDGKKIMRMGLSIEELIGILIEKNPDADTLDLRAYALPASTGIQIRFTGKKYNPFEHIEEDGETYMGISMLQNMAVNVRYTYALGMNTINIGFS